MAYQKTDWKDFPSTETPIDATKLNNIENGIANAVEKTGDTLTGELLFENKDDFNAIRKTRTLNGTDYQLAIGLGGNGSARMEFIKVPDNVLSSVEVRSDGVYNGVSGKKLAEQESSGDLDMQSNSVKFGNNGNVLWKESGYGDKFAIKADFNGADDNNKLKIQGAVGGAGTDPNLIDLINISGKTGATTFIGSVASPNFIGATNGYTWDMTTENTTDTWLIVLNNSKIQHRTVNSVIDSCVKKDGNQTIHGMITVEAVNSPNTYNNNVLTAEPNLYITSTGKFRRVNNASSKRYKKDIKLVEDDILNPERLYNLDIKQFKYKEEYQPNKNDSRYGKDLIGFIAEDVEKVFPIAVDYTEDENGNKIVDNWNERYIIPAMLKLIQNQKKKIDELEDRIKILEER